MKICLSIAAVFLFLSVIAWSESGEPGPAAPGLPPGGSSGHSLSIGNSGSHISPGTYRRENERINLEFKELQSFNTKSNTQWGPVLRDIINHEAPGDTNDYRDKVTIAHETTHGINAYIRRLAQTSKKLNGFYVLENRAVLIEEPNITKNQIAPFVPASLRSRRYNTYIAGMPDWDDTPLYVWDEWVAYTNGGEAAVNQVRQGLWNDGWRDAVAGQMEFCVFAIATAMAVKKNDPGYFYANLQFRSFLAWNLERSMSTVRAGRAMKEFRYEDQDAYYENLRLSADAEDLRSFTRELFGGEWACSVMGF